MATTLTSKTSLQLDQCVVAWLVTHYAAEPPAAVTSALHVFDNWDAVGDICERLGAYRAKRLISRWRTMAEAVPRDDLAQVEQRGDKVWLGTTQLGSVLRLYRDVMPQETQSRIAYETFIFRFLRYLERTTQTLVIESTDVGALIFIPEGIADPSIAEQWRRFVQWAFSATELRETLVLLLNSVKLTERGFSVPDVPVVTEDQAYALAAFVYATMRDIRQRFRRYERQIAQGDKNAGQLQERLTIQQANYGDALAAMEDLERREPKRMQRVRDLAEAYTPTATSQLKTTRAIVSKFPPYVETMLTLTPEQYLEIPPLLMENLPPVEPRLPGDAERLACYACGRALSKPKRGSTTHVYTASKFIFRAPSQTLQNFFTQTEPVVCPVCAALAVVCPIKAADDALIMSLREQSRDAGARRDDIGWLYEQHLHMLTMGELNVVAGRYLMIAALEQGPTRKPLKAQMGSYEYALFKLASLLPTDVLERFAAVAYLGGSPRDLPQRHVVTLRYLIDVFDLMPWALRDSRNAYAAMADAIRYVEHDALTLAIYRLFDKSDRKVHFSISDLATLEQGRETFARRLEMEGQVDTAQRYRDLAGLTGVLYALVDYCNSKMKNGSVGDNTRRRELRKLMEDVSNGNHFTYGVAGHLDAQWASLWRTQQTYFVYDEAVKLLAETGATLEQRESIDEKGQRRLTVTFDDVGALYAYLFAARYKTVRNQHDFTYDLKLSLFSRFPELLGNDDRKGSVGASS